MRPSSIIVRIDLAPYWGSFPPSRGSPEKAPGRKVKIDIFSHRRCIQTSLAKVDCRFHAVDFPDVSQQNAVHSLEVLRRLNGNTDWIKFGWDLDELHCIFGAEGLSF